jgi:hypothetical protein
MPKDPVVFLIARSNVELSEVPVFEYGWTLLRNIVLRKRCIENTLYILKEMITKFRNVLCKDTNNTRSS